jgi:hypothetical protein
LLLNLLLLAKHLKMMNSWDIFFMVLMAHIMRWSPLLKVIQPPPLMIFLDSCAPMILATQIQVMLVMARLSPL